MMQTRLKLQQFLSVGLVALAGLSGITNALAGVEIGGTRLVFLGSAKEANITVHNTDKNSPYLIQSWVEDLSENDNPPFIVTPPLFRLDGQQQNILRILKTTGELPKDRESVFWLNIKSIPAVRDDMKGKNVLQFSVKNRMKLFYRPTNLDGTPEQAAINIHWKTSNNQLVAVNDSVYFVNLASVAINGKKISLDYMNNMIPPKGKMLYSLTPVPIAGNNIEWKTINDYGSVSKVTNSIVQ
jgi:P pilus assembly chaperone PapD